MSDWLKDCLRLQWKILAFRATQADIEGLSWKHLPFGLFWALLAGVGRAWDNQNAGWVLHSGLPSVVYVFLLSLFLWLFTAPLRPPNWRLEKLTAFVSFTALPGVIYAVPFEMLLLPDDAVVANEILLLIVASWRVALLTFFLAKASLTKLATATAVCLPLSLIILTLVAFDYLEKTFSVMGGFRYYVVQDETLAKPFLDEHGKLPNFSRGSLDTLHTRGYQGNHTVYKEYSHSGWSPRESVPPGMREVGWDDPEYMPPGPVIAVARMLKILSGIAAPVFGIVYLTYCLSNFVRWIKELFKKLREKRAENNGHVDLPTEDATREE